MLLSFSEALLAGDGGSSDGSRKDSVVDDKSQKEELHQQLNKSSSSGDQTSMDSDEYSGG